MRPQRFPVAGLVAVAAASGWGAPAAALDGSNPAQLITETVASTEALRTYDNVKKYGAERVADRTRAHVKPAGIRAGNFWIFPSAETRVIYDDNIFSSATNKVDDIRTELTPSFVIRSRLPRHVLNFVFDGQLVSFAENDDQNFANARAAVDGAVHIDHAHTLGLSAMTELTHEERGSLAASLQASEAIPIHHSKVSVGLTRDVGRLYGTLSATAERFDFYDIDAIGGGTIEQDGRDLDVFATQLRTGYRFSPGFEAISKLRLLRQINATDGHSDLDATGYEALAGLSLETSPLLRWSLLGGYGIRDYDVNPDNSSGTMLLEGEVQWLPTERMTVYGSVARNINDFSGEGFKSYVETSIKGRVDYDVYNNLVLKLGANFAHADFEGIERTDKTYSGSIGLEYFMNKNWLFTFSYEHEVRQSDDDLFDMTSNRFMVGAKLRF